MTQKVIADFERRLLDHCGFEWTFEKRPLQKSANFGINFVPLVNDTEKEIGFGAIFR